jgi:hypothetical protein
MLGIIPTNKPIDPILKMIADMNGQDADIKCIQTGFYTSPLNFSSIVENNIGRTLPLDQKYPSFKDPYLGEFGICDTPQQFIDKYFKRLFYDNRILVVGFAHISKDTSNKGKGGGWRWHKWGEYVGEGNPQCEYLDDEEDFADGVYVYTIVDVS